MEIPLNIIESCTTSDPKAQKELYDIMTPRMFPVCYRLMGNRQDAEDCLQEGFIKIFTSIGTFENKGSFEGWARRVFTNTCINELKKRTKDLSIENVYQLEDQISSNKNFVFAKFEYDEIHKAIITIPNISRAIFVLHAIEGYPLNEISDLFGIKPSACRCRYMRTRNKIADIISKNHSFASRVA